MNADKGAGGDFSSQGFSLSQRPLLAAAVLPPSKSLDTSDIDKTSPYLLSHKSGGLQYGRTMQNVQYLQGGTTCLLGSREVQKRRATVNVNLTNSDLSSSQESCRSR